MNVRGEFIKTLRVQRGWTQQQMAEIANLSLRTVQRIENQNVASNESISALAAVLERPREEILTLALEPQQLAQVEKRLAWVLPAATTVGAALGSAGTWLVMRWISS